VIKKQKSNTRRNPVRVKKPLSLKISHPPQPIGEVIYGVSEFNDEDAHYFREGNHFRLYEKLGAHLRMVGRKAGAHFAVWAPDAESVSVVGDFNNWNPGAHPLSSRWDSTGLWEGFIPGVPAGAIYKYHIVSRFHRQILEKADPYAFFCEMPPKTASVVSSLNYDWHDDEWIQNRYRFNDLNSPMSIYEMHLPSWRKVPEDGNRSLSYRELGPRLADYVQEMGFTHVEFMPVMEHPFYASWGYQVTGYFAPSSRYGSPQDFMYLVDYLHEQGIGVILDWVPSHFPGDLHGLMNFDGTDLYEHNDDKKGFHPDWKSYIFNYGRNEVRSFLISSALFWLDRYHADGLRVDAVASMLYLDYSRKEGEWIPNAQGGRENLDAIHFLKRLNEAVYKNYPGTQMIAEESTSWTKVSKPIHEGGLGFGLKWNMGWMHDTLEFFSKDPVYRKHHHNNLTFSMLYAFTENFMLSLSHDEVVHGKGSLLSKMPGECWQKFANLRQLFGYMYGFPGKKLLFMGAELAQGREWDHDSSLDWHLLGIDWHKGIQTWVKDLNHFYRNEPVLFQKDFTWEGFSWIDFSDTDSGVVSFIRRGATTPNVILVVCNLTPVTRYAYRVGVPAEGYWKEVLNSDAFKYGGGNQGNCGGVNADWITMHNQPYSLNLTLPALSVIFLKREF
jgi:1,4-alpha-glucan branching enzyme